MFRCTTLTMAVSAALLLTAYSEPSTSATPEADSLLTDIRAAMGIDELQAITYSGYAWRIRNSFMQSRTASPPWVDRDEIIDYQRTIDLDNRRSLAEGETFAQNLFFDPRIKGAYQQHIQPDQGWRQHLEIFLTPWGFLEGASHHETEVSAENGGYRLSWNTGDHHTSPAGQSYTVTAWVNEDNLIERTETRVEDSFLGDMLVAMNFSDYEMMGDLQVPTIMEQERGGGMVFGVHIRTAEANPDNLSELLEAPEGGGGPGFGSPSTPDNPVTELADGVWEIAGGYHSLVVEFSDHLVVFEAGQSEAWGSTILEHVQELSDKPIRYLVNSHPHSDHTGGIVPFVREGATVLTHHSNVDFLEKALSTPRTLLGEETLAPRFRPAPDGVTVLEDDSGMRLELHHVPTWHSEGMLVGLLPEQGIMFQADFSLPLGGAEANPFVVALAHYVQDAGIEFEQYRSVHPAPVPQTMDDLMAAIKEE